MTSTQAQLADRETGMPAGCPALSIFLSSPAELTPPSEQGARNIYQRCHPPRPNIGTAAELLPELLGHLAAAAAAGQGATAAQLRAASCRLAAAAGDPAGLAAAAAAAFGSGGAAGAAALLALLAELPSEWAAAGHGPEALALLHSQLLELAGGALAGGDPVGMGKAVAALESWAGEGGGLGAEILHSAGP